MKCTFEHRECSVFFSSSALAHCRCLVSITASLKLNQGGSSKVSVETKTKPNQTSAPQIEPGGGLVEGCRRNQNQTCIPPTSQPATGLYFHESFQNILSEEKYFSIGRIVGAVTAQSLASIGDLHKSHFLLLETQYTRTTTKKTNDKDECQISK